MTSGPGSLGEVSHPRAPMFSLSLALVAGILLAQYCWRPPFWIGTAAVVFWASAAILVVRRPRFAWLLAHGAIIALGWVALAGQTGQTAADAHRSDISAFLGGQEVSITAHVIREPGIVAPGVKRGDHVQLDVETESLSDDTQRDNTQRSSVAAGIRLSVYQHAEEAEYLDEFGAIETIAERLRDGDRIRFTAKLRPPKNFRNPGAFDYAGYLRDQGIVALGSAKNESIELLPGRSGGRISRWRSAARRSLILKIHQIWPERRAGLMDAMLIGERAFIDREMSTEFQRSGTFHVLVVSGMNVSILAFAVFWFFRRLRLGQIAASILTIVLAIAYAYLCDGGAPILRATVMFSVFLIARLFYRTRSPLNALGTAAVFVLLADPKSLFDSSFQLTFLCVVAIAGIGVPLLERTSGPWRQVIVNFQATAYDVSLPPRVAQMRLDLRLIIGRLARFLPTGLARFLVLRFVGFVLATWEVLTMSALMQITLALPMIVYFHRATIMAMPANILVVPLNGILMPAAAAALALAYIARPLATVPALIAGWALDATTGTVHILGSLRIADLRLPEPGAGASGLAISAIVLAILCARRSRALVAASLSLLLASAIYLVAAPACPHVHGGAMEVSAIDVGQADSTLIVAPDGRALLVDAAGPLGFSHSEFDFGENVVSPYLWERGFKRLDVVVVTHGHSDHLGGMGSVMNNFHPRELWVGPLPDVPATRDLLARARALKVQVIEHRAGDEFRWGGIEVRVLSPPRDYQVGEKVKNNDSLVLHFQYGETSALLEGDAEKQMEKIVATEHPQTTLLKLAHNGSTTSTTPELLDAARPSIAFISVGARNPFHHPRAEVLARLAERHILTYRTDTMGALTFVLDGKKVYREAE